MVHFGTRSSLVRLRRFAWGAILVLHCGAAAAGTVAPFQSAARPQGLELTAPVQLAAIDARAQAFQSRILPQFLDAATTRLGERQVVMDLSALSLDSARLVVTKAVVPRVYFVAEGAGYHNTLLSQVFRADGQVEDMQIVFPNASSAQSYQNRFQGAANRRAGAPLASGDFVDLGTTLQPGDRLAFHLLANGAKGGNRLYSTDPGLNADGLPQHIVNLAMQGRDVSRFTLMGFEDLWGGGDRDFNDLVFAVDFGRGNLRGFKTSQNMIAAPVPLPAVALISGLAMLVGMRRFQNPRA